MTMLKGTDRLILRSPGGVLYYSGTLGNKLDNSSQSQPAALEPVERSTLNALLSYKAEVTHQHASLPTAHTFRFVELRKDGNQALTQGQWQKAELEQSAALGGSLYWDDANYWVEVNTAGYTGSLWEWRFQMHTNANWQQVQVRIQRQNIDTSGLQEVAYINHLETYMTPTFTESIVMLEGYRYWVEINPGFGSAQLLDSLWTWVQIRNLYETAPFQG